MESKSRYSLEMILLLTGFVFAAAVFWQAAFSAGGMFKWGTIASVLTTCCIMCIVEIADRYMHGPVEGD